MGLIIIIIIIIKNIYLLLLFIDLISLLEDPPKTFLIFFSSYRVSVFIYKNTFINNLLNMAKHCVLTDYKDKKKTHLFSQQNSSL